MTVAFVFDAARMLRPRNRAGARRLRMHYRNARAVAGSAPDGREPLLRVQ